MSVFSDNAGVVRFDDEHDVCFKVETHNHPSAIDPYGGANTGLGGVIRDALGTGLGAKPICNTDVFCVAPPDLPPEQVPAGVLHPKRVLKGVVAGVRDYGNRMGIPTVNGALAVDPGYLANPLVFCGTVGVLPRGMSEKRVVPGDLIVAIGGRTGRDGIHGATFSSVELTARERSRLRRRGPDRQRDHREDGARRDPPGPRSAALSRDHRLRRRRLQLGGRRDGGRARRRGRSRSALRSSTRDFLIPRSGSPRPRSGWCWPCRPRNGRHSRNYATAKGSRRPTWASSSTRGGSRCVTTASWSPTCRWTFCTKAGRRSSARRPGRRPSNGRCDCPLAAISQPTWSPCSRTGTCAARNGSSASMTMRSRAGR